MFSKRRVKGKDFEMEVNCPFKSLKVGKKYESCLSLKSIHYPKLYKKPVFGHYNSEASFV